MRLSIIVPMFNSEKTIVRAINSCLFYDCENVVEVILVDDGSKDSTVELVNQTFSQQLINKTLRIVQLNHQGAGNARNVGIRKATGDWIAFLDSDDQLKNLSQVLNDLSKIQNKNVQIVNYSNRKNKADANKLLKGKKLLRDNLGLSRDETKLWDSGPICKFYKRSFLITNSIQFPVNIKVGEDLIFNLLCLESDPLIYVKDMEVYEIFENNTSITHLIIYQDIYNDATKLTKAVLKFNLPMALKNEFIVKNFSIMIVRFLKSQYPETRVIKYLQKYKAEFSIDGFQSSKYFLKIRKSVGIFASIICLTCWKFPGSVKGVFPLVKKVRY